VGSMNKSLLAPVVVLMGFNFLPTAEACTLVSFDNDGRYVGGNLITQITAKADTIQIVRVTDRHIFRRTYSKGEWYLQFGNTNVPKSEPEFIDEYVFALSVVETLKATTPARENYYENNPRVRGYSAAELSTNSPKRSAAEDTRPPPNSLPDWLFDHPGHDRMAFTGGASESANLSPGLCNPPYFLDVGQTLIAFRDSMGRLYPTSGAFPLKIDGEFLENRRKTRVTFNMQSLVPIANANDPFLQRIRQALSHRVR